MRVEFAKSLSGHDRNHIYLVYEEAEEFSMLVNGTNHGTSNPKKKNKKHFQIIKKLPDDIREICDTWQELSDVKIHQVIKLYEKRIKESQYAL